MATYKQIQEWVKENYGFTVKTCWIAHVKEMYGLTKRKAPNRINKKERTNPCPPDKVEPIVMAFQNFKMIDAKNVELIVQDKNVDLFSSLGIHVEQDDFAYFFILIQQISTDPEQIKKKMKLFSHLIEKMIPDENYTQIRGARLLFAFEKICFAFRKILEIEDMNVIFELKKISKEYFNNYTKSPENAGKVANKHLTALINKIKNHESVDVKTSVNILENIDKLLDINKENRDFVSLISYSGKKSGARK